MLKSFHTVLYKVNGINAAPGQHDVRIYDMPGIEAWLTADADRWGFKVERKAAITQFMMSRSFQAKETSLEDTIKSAQAEKTARFGQGLYLVIVITGKHEGVPEVTAENGEYVVGYDAVDNDSIRTNNKEILDKIVLAFCMANQEKVSVILRTNDVYYELDGRLYYNFNAKASMNLTISRQVDEAYLQGLGNVFKTWMDKTLPKKLESLYAKVQIEDDKMKAFLFAWTGLEIFVNTSFEKYKREFYADIKKNEPPIRQKFYERIQDVMKDRYNPRDKFNIICARLSPPEPEADMKAFQSFQELRNKMSHGEEINEDLLPTQEVREFLEKYLKYDAER